MTFSNHTTVSGGGTAGSSRTNPHWLQLSSFHANDTMVTIVPSFTSEKKLPLLSSKHSVTMGPFIAGMPCQVPLWMAKVLHQRQLAQIQLPDWLSATPIASPTASESSLSSASYLVHALQEEKHQPNLLSSDRLPFYYYEIARALSPNNSSATVTASTTTIAGTSSSTSSLVEPSTQLVLQDLHTVRVDKIRQHFHQLSREELAPGELTTMIEVTGIASIELATVGPFLKQAFEDYASLTHKTSEEDTAKKNNESESSTGRGGKDRQDQNLDKENTDDYNKADRQRTSLVRSRLRRFRS